MKDIDDVLKDKPDLTRKPLSQFVGEKIVIHNVSFSDTRKYGTRVVLTISLLGKEKILFDVYTFSQVVMDFVTVLKDEMPFSCKIVQEGDYLTLISAK